MKKVKEIRDPKIVQLITKAAQLRSQRKKIIKEEETIKTQLKKIMIEQGVKAWMTLSGYKAILEERNGRSYLDLKAIAMALGITQEQLEKYKKKGRPIYALTCKITRGS